ncbi:hypothetical protein CYMTET_35326, partial [Cymbomonas tetramitiformis]
MRRARRSAHATGTVTARTAGWRGGLSAYSFSNEDAENSVLAARFQQAIDDGNAEEFDALCVIAG